MVVAFFVPGPRVPAPQGLRAAWPAVRDRQVGTGMWLTMLAGLGFGVLDVLAPLRLSDLGATATIIGATFLGAAAIESALSPMAGCPIGVARWYPSGYRCSPRLPSACSRRCSPRHRCWSPC